MKVKVTEHEVIIDLYGLISDMPSESLPILADAIAVNDDVIKFVTQQILDGITDFCSCAGRVRAAKSKPQAGLDWACREVAKRAGDVATREIERLERELQSRLAQIQDLQQQLNDYRRPRR